MIEGIRQQITPEGADPAKVTGLVNDGVNKVLLFMTKDSLSVTDKKVQKFMLQLREDIATLTSQTSEASEVKRAEQDPTRQYRRINIEFAGHYPRNFTLAEDITWGMHRLKARTKLSFKSAGGPGVYYEFIATAPDGRTFTIFEPEKNLPKDIAILEE